MGAWSVNSFGNDDAMDWLSDLAEHGGELIEATLADVVEFPETECLEAPLCSEALAAAEMVVAALGAPPQEEFPEDAAEWLASHEFTVSAALVDLTRLAIERIATKSELKELWDESGSSDEWYQCLAGLRKRIG